MNIISYTIELKSDAQTGSGFGGESVNNYVTRDCSGNPVVHASHIKGLLRQTLRDIFGDLQWDRGMIDQALGLPGSPPPVPGGQDKSASAGEESGFVFSDACADRAAKSGQPMTRVITRTALDAGTGRVKSGALRAGGGFRRPEISWQDRAAVRCESQRRSSVAACAFKPSGNWRWQESRQRLLRGNYSGRRACPGSTAA